jgi:hypothetical protein
MEARAVNQLQQYAQQAATWVEANSTTVVYIGAAIALFMLIAPQGRR